ncbi:MAG: queuosine salvage family protein [Candidatus Magasanikbacteria bacterium]|nr:queuosine salvage family protein [Candidatus Magasanikbacteria bacterium]
MNTILQSTKFVVDHSEFVKINHDKVFEFAKDFKHENVCHWLSAAPFEFSKLSDEQKLHFLFLFNALSFSYWGEPKWTIEYHGNQIDGSWGLISAIDRGLSENMPLLDFKYCTTISREDFIKLLHGSVEIPLFEERLNFIRQLGTVMCEKYNGDARELLAEAGGNAQKLVEIILKDFPLFTDESEYKGEKIIFAKRAQLLVADIYQMFGGKNFGALKNIDQITACADYKLPQILRRVGIFEYTPQLAEKIDNKIELAHDSPEEVEIRANTIWAVVYIKERVEKMSPGIFSFEVNDHLWLATQEKIAGEKPYHRTRTTAY